jgi:hypothetical protein
MIETDHGLSILIRVGRFEGGDRRTLITQRLLHESRGTKGTCRLRSQLTTLIPLSIRSGSHLPPRCSPRPPARFAAPPHPLFPPVPGPPLFVEAVLREFRREMRDVLLQLVSSGSGVAGGEGA